jgi:hypothetical protein
MPGTGNVCLDRGIRGWPQDPYDPRMTEFVSGEQN